jgi:5-bromo-4-chloroindolyl phosphate hydrolysis protein
MEELEMYQNIINDVDGVINQHKENKIKTGLTEKEKFYFIQGLEVAKQIIENAEDIAIDEIAYETFEDTVKALKDSLD